MKQRAATKEKAAIYPALFLVTNWNEATGRHWAAAAAELGQALEPESRGGLSDGNQLWDAVPTLDGLGPSGDNDHSSERSEDGTKLPEYADVGSFVPKAALNIAALQRLLA